jgi:hypothetical protein
MAVFRVFWKEALASVVYGKIKIKNVKTMGTCDNNLWRFVSSARKKYHNPLETLIIGEIQAGADCI